jgi:acyl-CoA thioesterase-1
MNGHIVGRWMALAAILLLGPVHRALAADICAAPAELTADVSAMKQVAANLKPGGTLNILTIGSATVFSPVESLQPGSVTGMALGIGSGPRPGPPASASDTAFPLQMATAMRQATPGSTVSVVVKGGRGMPATEMLDILHTELAAHHYQLVIWQTGTVEAVRNVPASAFYQTLSDGAAAIAKAGADLVLVDPQFSRFLHANVDITPFEQAMQQVAAQPGVMLFHRFDLMRHWANEGQIDLERTPKGKRLKAVEALHACLGESLARMVAAGANAPS